VNGRQKDGRGGCNESKFSALEDFVRAREVRLIEEDFQSRMWEGR